MAPDQTVIAVDFGRSKIATALVDSKLAVHDQRRHDVSGTNGFSELVKLIIEHTSEMAQDHPEAAAIGVSFAGHVDARRGLVYGREVIKGDRPHVGRGHQRQVELAALLSERSGRPTAIENDGTAATLAEWRAGTAVGYDDVVCFAIGTHIGSGLVAGGQLIHRRTSGPLLGALVSQDSRGELVIVGDRCSGSGVALLAQSHGLPADARQVAKMAQAGDERAAQVIREVGHWLGIMLASTINVYDPEIIVLGGGVMAGELGKMMLEAARAVLAAPVTLPGLTGEPQIVFAHFGGEAGLVGAALAAQALALN